MNDSVSFAGSQAAGWLPDPAALLRSTDWASLECAAGSAKDIPATMALLFDTDPEVRVWAVDHGLSAVRHQNTIYEATLPAASYVAAILTDPRTTVTAPHTGWDLNPRQCSLRAALIDWLGELGMDADEEILALRARRGSSYPDFDALRALRPVLFRAVAAFLHDDDLSVRHAALAAAVSFAEAPELAGSRPELVECARSLLASSTTDRYHRDRATDALTAWEQTTQTPAQDT